MELLLDIDKFADLVNEGWNSAFTEEEQLQISQELNVDGIAELRRVNIGPGADLLVILVAINTIVDSFLVGSKLLEGVVGWKKLIGWLKKLMKAEELVSVDEAGATVLALDYLAHHYDYDTITKEDAHTIPFNDLSYMIPANKNGIARHPHAYYVQTYLLDGDRYCVLGIKSTGEVNLIKSFRLNPYALQEEKH